MPSPKWRAPPRRSKPEERLRSGSQVGSRVGAALRSDDRADDDDPHIRPIPAPRVVTTVLRSRSRLWRRFRVHAHPSALDSVPPRRETRKPERMWLFRTTLFRTTLFRTTLYGQDLAERVATLLDRGGQIADCHAYYCGTGFVFHDSNYCWAHIDDGYPGAVIQAFESREEFVRWLAAQSDQSLGAWHAGSGRLQIPGLSRMRKETAHLRA